MKLVTQHSIQENETWEVKSMPAYREAVVNTWRRVLQNETTPPYANVQINGTNK